MDTNATRSGLAAHPDLMSVPEADGSLPLVSVVVPAFNAGLTIARTLATALAQTHCAIEVLVVDDGSVDNTRDVVAGIAATDPRVRLLTQSNRGVSAARNKALAASSGDFVAPLDADDIWAPEKLEVQIAALRSAPRAALAYAWFRRIDSADRIVPPSPHPGIEGRVLHRHLAWNFISNGSSILVRGDVARAVSYDEDLRSGCEDYLHQLVIALRHEFVCVPKFLVGYRVSPGSLSSSRIAMEEAHLAMFDKVAPLLPQSALPVLARRRAEMYARLARHYLRVKDLPKAVRHLQQAMQADAVHAAANFTDAIASVGRANDRSDHLPGPPFASIGADFLDGEWQPQRSRRYLGKLDRLDRS